MHLVKQRILSHEYEELVEDDYSDKGHLDLIFRQARSGAQRATGAGRPAAAHHPGGHLRLVVDCPDQAVAGGAGRLHIAEWTNDDRLLGDLGGGNCGRLYERWSQDLKFTDEQMPNFTAHRAADEKHSEMFLDIFERLVPEGRGGGVLSTARESMASTGPTSVAWPRPWRGCRSASVLGNGVLRLRFATLMTNGKDSGSAETVHHRSS